MALVLSTYVDPSVYVQEVIAPGALNLQTLPVLPSLVAHGSRLRREVNEDVVRGLVSAEALTVAGTTPHVATLSQRSDRRVGNTTVFADGVALNDNFISYPAATITGTTTETFDVSTNNAFVLTMDGNASVTITLSSGASAVAVTGSQIDVTTTLASSGAAATAAEVAAGINAGLAAATALGYGTAYNAVASASAGSIVLTSPVSTPASNITVSAAVTTDASAALFGTALQSAVTLRIADTVYDASVAYTANYVSVTDAVDQASIAGVSSFVKVGAFPGVGTYSEGVDFTVPSAGQLNWTAALVAATTQSLDGSSNFDLSTNDTLRLAFDGRATIDIDLNGLGSPPLGYANPSTPSATTPAEIAANINAVVGASSTYGPTYSGVATVASNRVVLTSPTAGSTGSVSIQHPAATDATTTIFGLSSVQTLTVTGTGAAPAAGSTYFITYDYARPTADYDNPQQFFTLDQALAFTGPVTTTNPLAIGTEIIFRNGAPSILLTQTNDASSNGSPSGVEYQASLDALGGRSVATDIIVLSTALDTQTRLLQHIEDQSGPIEQNYRRGYFGMSRNTAIGDRDTADTLVFRAARTLQVAADSPARGRLMLVAPPGIEGLRKTLLLEDGTTTTLMLDGTYLACAIAGRMAGFTSPSATLVRQTLAGFDADDSVFTPWRRAERATMASQGVTVVTYDAGRFVLLDPISTERAGGGLIQFEQWSSSVQKDNISRKVRAALDANAVGIVPIDVADFIIDIKTIIANVLAGEVADGAIGPFTDSLGNRRAIDLNQDVVVVQNATDPTTYNFNYYFNLRYPALRLLGQFSVDNPFFVQTS